MPEQSNLRDDLTEVRKHIREKYQTYAAYAGPGWDEKWLEQVEADEAILDRAIARLQPAATTWLNS